MPWWSFSVASGNPRANVRARASVVTCPGSLVVVGGRGLDDSRPVVAGAVDRLGDGMADQGAHGAGRSSLERTSVSCWSGSSQASKFTTQSLGTPSAAAVSSSSETRSRFVRVSADTTTAWMRAATGFLVRTNTGRSPPGVAVPASPRCIETKVDRHFAATIRNITDPAWHCSQPSPDGLRVGLLENPLRRGRALRRRTL